MTERIIDYCRLESGFAAAQRPFALPGDTPHYARDRIVDVRHIKLDISIDPKAKRIEGDGVHDARADQRRRLARRVRRGRDGDQRSVRARAARSSAVLVRGRQAAHRAWCEAEGGRGADGRGRVRGAAAARPVLHRRRTRATRRSRVQAWTQGQDEDSRHWFPCFDFPNEMATSEMIVTVPKPFTAVSQRRAARACARTGGARTFHFRQDVPHVAYLLSVAAGEFAEIDEARRRRPSAVLRQKGREDEARRALGRTPEMMRFFSERDRRAVPVREVRAGVRAATSSSAAWRTSARRR